MICIHRKQNVLGKLVIPKIISAIQYIWSELEEQEREESFRLKRFKQNKAKKFAMEHAETKAKLKAKMKKEEDVIIEEPHLIKEPDLIKEPEPDKIEEEDTKVRQATELEPEVTDTTQESAVALPDDTLALPDDTLALPDDTLALTDDTLCPCTKTVREIEEDTGEFICPICKLVDEAINTEQEIKVTMVPCQTCLPKVTENKHRLEHLMAHVNQIFKITKQYNNNKMAAENKNEIFSYTTLIERHEYVPYCLRCTCSHMRLTGQFLPQSRYIECNSFNKPERLNVSCSCPPVYHKQSCRGEDSQQTQTCSCYSSESETEICPWDDPKAVDSEICSCDDRKPVKSETCSCDEPMPVYSEACPCESPGRQPVGECICEPYQQFKQDSVNISRGLRSTISDFICSTSHSSTAGEHQKSSSRPYGPTVASVPYALCANEMARKIVKASVPYLGKFCGSSKCSKKTCYPVCQGDVSEKIAKASASYLRTGSNNPYLCNEPNCGKNNFPNDTTTYFAAPSQLKTPFRSENRESKSEDAKDMSYVLDPFSSAQVTPYFDQKLCCPVCCSNTVTKTDNTTDSTSSSKCSYCDNPNCSGQLMNSESLYGTISQWLHSAIHRDDATKRSPEPYTREGKPGPCGISAPKNITIDQDPIYLTSHTKERNQGSLGTSEEDLPDSAGVVFTPYKKDPTDSDEPAQHSCSFNTNQIKLQPYTREGKPGPCGVNKKNNCCSEIYYTYPVRLEYKVGSITDRVGKINSTLRDVATYVTTVSQKHAREGRLYRVGTTVSSQKAYTSNIAEGNPGSCPICRRKADTKETRLMSYTPERKPVPCSMQDTCATSKTNQLTTSPYTREGRPGPCGIQGMTVTPEASQSTILPYTREGKPGPCGIQDTVITSKPRLTPVSHTQEGIMGPCGVFGRTVTAHSIEAHSTPYTREGRPGPCGIQDSSVTPDLSRSALSPYTREGRPGPCGIHDNTATSKSNQSRLSLYAQEGMSEPCGICGRTVTAHSIETHSTPYTREGRPGPCGIQDTSVTPDLGQFALSPYTREGRPGPCGIQDPTPTSKSNQSPLSPYTQGGISGACGIFGRTVTVHPIKTHSTPYTREGRPGPCGIQDSSVTPDISRPALSSYTREGRPGPCAIHDNTTISKSNQSSLSPYSPEGMSGPCGIFEKTITAHPTETHSTPYTREGKPGPCGIQETSITPKLKELPILSYTREGLPGPCGIFGKAVTAHPTRTYSTPFTREGRPGPCDVQNAFVTPKSRKSSLLPYTREGKPGPCGIQGTSVIYTSDETKYSTGGIHEINNEARSSDNTSPFSKDPAVYYYVTDISQPFVLNTLKKSRQYGTNECNFIHTTKSDICSAFTYVSGKYPSFIPYMDKNNSDRRKVSTAIPRQGPSINPIYKDSATYVRSVCRKRHKYYHEVKPTTSAIIDRNTTIHQKQYICELLTRTQSLDSYRASSYELARPHACCPSMKNSADYSPYLLDIRPVYSNISTSSFANIQSKPETRDFLARVKLSGKFSVPSLFTRYSTVTVNYVLCQADIQASIDKASAAYLNRPNFAQTWPLLPKVQAEIKKASKAYLNIDDTDPNDMGAAIAKASVAYFKKAPSICMKPSEPSSTAAHRLPPEHYGAFTPTPGITTSYPKWITTNVTKDTSNVSKDICAPYFKSVSSNTNSIGLNPRTCNSYPYESEKASFDEPKCGHMFDPLSEKGSYPGNGYACPSEKSSQNESKYGYTFQPTSDKSLPPAPSVCSNCGKNKNLPSGVSFPSNISYPSNKTGDPGYLETEFKEITKVSRYMNPDGSIIDERQIITIKTEKKIRQKSSNSNKFEVGTCISCSEEYDINSQHKIDKKRSFECRPTNRYTKSDIVKGNNDMTASPKLKRCISAPECENILFGTWETGPELEITVSKTPLSVLMPCLSSDLTCGNRLQYTASGNKCLCTSTATSITMFESPQVKNYNKYHNQFNYAYVLLTPTVETNKFQDINKDQKYNYAGIPSTRSVLKCSCEPDLVPGKSAGSVCGNRLSDTDSGPKCYCGDSTSINSDPKCSCPEGSPCITTRPVCANRLEDTDSGPKCGCVDAPTGVTTYVAECGCPEGSPCVTTNQLYATRLKVSDSGAKCSSADGILSNFTSKDCSCAKEPAGRSTDPVYINRSEHNESDPNCKCATNSSCAVSNDSGCICPGELLDTVTKTVCDIQSENTDSGLKCYCKNESSNAVPKKDPECNCPEISHFVATDLVCANRLEDTVSGSKCCCADKSPETIGNDPICSCPEQLPDTSNEAVCVNPLEHTDSGTKCNCPDELPGVVSSDLECICLEKSPDVSNELANGPSKDSEPKCNCTDESSGTVTSNLECCCPEGSRCMTTDSVCANRLEDTFSGSKCRCADRSPDTNSNDQNCSCPEELPYASTKPICVNQLETTGSDPKCNCPDGSPASISNDPVCSCLEEFSGTSNEPVCVHPSGDTDRSLKCNCIDKPSSTVISKGRECSCPEGSRCMTTDLVCENRLEDTSSGPKCVCADISSSIGSAKDPTCKCPEGSISISTIPTYASRIKDTDSGQNCNCPQELPKACIDSPREITAKTLADCSKCICPEGSLCLTHSVCAISQKDKNSGPKGDYGTSTTT